MPILHSGTEGDLRLAATLDQSLFSLLTDTASIRTVPGAIEFLGTVNGSLSDTHGVRFAGLDGADPMVATAAEHTDVTETALTDAHTDIAVARQALRRDIGDLFVATGNGQLDANRLAVDMVASYESRFNAMWATAAATASQNVGTSTVDMSHDDFMDAIFELELDSVPGPFFCGLHPRQFADWQESLRAEGGSAVFNPATNDMLSIKGPGYAGEYLGVSVYKFEVGVGGLHQEEAEQRGRDVGSRSLRVQDRRSHSPDQRGNLPRRADGRGDRGAPA